MSDDVVIRVAVVVAVGLAAVVTAMVARRGAALRRRTVTLSGHGPGVVFFSSETCSSCAEMRVRLADWPDVIEISYESAGAAFPAEIDRVPAVALLADDGTGWVAFGLVSRHRLARWIADGP